ncbi:MAG: hypothetical protein KO217_01035 [Methanobacteriaceae archaeon]|nr:hypothetical protein [Methanobacteriaceae archaeon]
MFIILEYAIGAIVSAKAPAIGANELKDIPDHLTIIPIVTSSRSPLLTAKDTPKMSKTIAKGFKITNQPR